MAQSSSKILLIIDDSEDLQILFKRIFESRGYQVVAALSGKEALDILLSGEELPNLIFLDLLLPDMNGLEFARIKEKEPKIKHIPMILMTAGIIDSEQITPFNFKTYLAKPLDLNQLLATVEHWADESR